MAALLISIERAGRPLPRQAARTEEGEGMIKAEITAFLRQQSGNDLIYMMRRQYPTCVCSSAPCPACGQSSCGGRICRLCIQSELHRRGISTLHTIHLMSALADAQTASDRIEQAAEAIRQAFDLTDGSAP